MQHRVQIADVSVGARLREFRLRRGLSQTELGSRLGVSYQQVQKYEAGKNRLTPGRLAMAASVLGAAPAEFFDAVEPGGIDLISAFVISPQGIELNRAFFRITDEGLRALVIRLVDAISQSVDE